MKKFGKWIARHHLRERYSLLWCFATCCWALSFHAIGLWAALGLLLSSIPIVALEVWWNEYADDYDDLEEGDVE